MPSRLNSVENTLGSGLPSGVSLPVSCLSPLSESTQILSNTCKYLSRIPGNDDFLSHEYGVIKQTTPSPVISTMRLSAMRKNRTKRLFNPLPCGLGALTVVR